MTRAITAAGQVPALVGVLMRILGHPAPRHPATVLAEATRPGDCLHGQHLRTGLVPS